MKYIDEFRDRKLIAKAAAEICRLSEGLGPFSVMEVCGTHTMAIFRFGLRELLPPAIRLISGPGCPVCVTPNAYLDKAIALASLPDVVVATFGDMLRVPGSRSSLDKEKAKGGAVRVVYSTDDALRIARNNPEKQVVFLGIGFETTAPTVAASIIAAKKERLTNYSVLCGHKTMPEVLKALASDREIVVDGFLLPGHVSAIIGTRPYEFLAKRYAKGCVVSGFEPVDILESILMLISQRSARVEIEYRRIASRGGNGRARRVLDTVFTASDSEWRGIGRVSHSGLAIRKEFAAFDAAKRFAIRIPPVKENARCACGAVLKGVKTPLDCPLFGKACNPEHPVGACMVSSEGACAAYYKYGKRK